MSMIRFRYEGVRYEVEVVRDGDVLTITHEGTAYRVELEPEVAPAAATPAPAPTPAPAAPSPTPTPTPAPTAAGPGVLPAPMTGTVKEVKVTAGDQVSAGQLVVVMEAMKMDIDVTATAAGTVAEVHVGPGDNRAAGQPLLTVQ
ncbi:MAG: acetyl-CoA carboxylase biotin carboxyl carrier protein subunit [Spirochaetaceae bacterium]|nr:acetyl-CoA carboxylase biotin carboxyl carrier protein subunit [Spirochaetaceae bacterium]